MTAQFSLSSYQLYLAPMEGVVDAILRQLLTDIGGIDRTVTEFVRVCDLRLPRRVFLRYCPELATEGCTKTGIPVHLQILGSHAEMLAQNAVKAVSLGARGIDINFGCPAKTVNKNRGGSVLLKEPEVLYDIVKQVRDAVPIEIPVSAKMRLGYDDKSLAIENAQAIADAGANELCVHARTRREGYRPPAHWDWVGKINDTVDIPVVANGDLFTIADIQQCIEVTGCQRLMIGRGLLRRPDLALQFKQPDAAPMTWPELLLILLDFVRTIEQQMLPKHAPGRVKQWLAYLKLEYPEAEQLFTAIKGNMTLAPILTEVERQVRLYHGDEWLMARAELQSQTNARVGAINPL